MYVNTRRRKLSNALTNSLSRKWVMTHHFVTLTRTPPSQCYLNDLWCVYFKFEDITLARERERESMITWLQRLIDERKTLCLNKNSTKGGVDIKSRKVSYECWYSKLADQVLRDFDSIWVSLSFDRLVYLSPWPKCLWNEANDRTIYCNRK